MKNKPKFLFIQIPKTGSTSIRTILKTPSGHQTLAYWNEIKHPYDYSFAFVRNTYTRLVSWYRHEYNQDIKGFREWVQNGCKVEWGSDWIASWQENNPMNQMNYITDKDGNVVIDFIGFFENIQDDYLEVCNQLDIENPPKLIKIIPRPFNSKNRKDLKTTSFSYNAKEYYDDKTKEMVDNLFSEEIEYFNFKFFE